jgi:hypothetical protein
MSTDSVWLFAVCCLLFAHKATGCLPFAACSQGVWLFAVCCLLTRRLAVCRLLSAHKATGCLPFAVCSKRRLSADPAAYSL